MPEPAATLTIGQVALRSGVAPSALRFYEAEGLIASERTDGNQRRYQRAVLRRVAVIQAGRAAGIPLAAIRDALALLPAHKPPSQRDWARLSRAWRRDVEERIALLERVRDDLAVLHRLRLPLAALVQALQPGRPRRRRRALARATSSATSPRRAAGAADILA